MRLGNPGRDDAHGQFDEDALESRLVWIFGSPRSGSTWLLQLLTHPLTADDDAPHGVKLLGAPDAGAPGRIPINEPYIPQHLTPSLFPPGPMVDDGYAAVTLNSFRHGNPHYFFSDRYEAAWRPALRHLVLARIHAQVASIAEAYRLRSPSVIIKEPNGSVGAELIMSLLPRARLIFLLRDGRDVVDSMIDAVAPGGWLAQPPPEGAPPFDVQRLALVRYESLLWRARTQAVQQAYDRHPARLRQLVRYEDMRANPIPVLAKLDRWFGWKRAEEARTSAVRWNDFDRIPDAVKGPGAFLRAAQPGLWRENLSADEQDVMTVIMGAKLAELGYEP